MNKLITLGAALIAAALSSSLASAADATYVRAGTAWFEPVDSDGFDGELGGLVAVGQSYGAHNLEAEIGYVEFSGSDNFAGLTASADLEVLPVTLGYRYDFELSDKLKLGVGANAGLAFTELNVGLSGVGSASDTDTTWIASGGLRLTYSLTDSVALSAAYRYILVDDLKFFSVELDDNDTHVFELGAEYHW